MIKAIRTDTQPVIIEEIQVFPTSVPVTNMIIHRGKVEGTSDGQDARLIVSSQSEIASLKLQRCSSDKFSSCRYNLNFHSKSYNIHYTDLFEKILKMIQRVRQVTRSLLRLGQAEAEMRSSRLVDTRRQFVPERIDWRPRIVSRNSGRIGQTGR